MRTSASRIGKRAAAVIGTAVVVAGTAMAFPVAAGTGAVTAPVRMSVAAGPPGCGDLPPGGYWVPAGSFRSCGACLAAAWDWYNSGVSAWCQLTPRDTANLYRFCFECAPAKASPAAGTRARPVVKPSPA